MLSPESDKRLIDHLLKFAIDNGATRAARILPDAIQVESRLAAYCREPRCPHYGMSKSCPPNVSGPGGMKKTIALSKHAIVLRIEIDSASLHGEGRPEVMRLLHELTASVEREAIRLGFTESVGFAGGSCRRSFCDEHDECSLLSDQGLCRYPNQARQSMSGFGVNVGELMKSAGWSANLFPENGDSSSDELAWVAGLVLLQ